MKKVEAIIKPFKVEDVKNGLAALGVQGLTILEARGFGRQKGHTEHWRGAEYTVEFVPKVKIEVIIPDRMLEDVVDVVMKAARTGQVGDGKIFISNLENVIRIRTAESGESAI